MKPISEALAAMLPAFKPCGRERVQLQLALGRVLAQDALARQDQPPFTNSAMDGYAVRAEDLSGASAETPKALPLAGESRAGEEAPPALAPGRTLRIFTGAPLPEGADAVVMQEDTSREGEEVSFQLAPAAGAHVRRRGEDLQAGAPILSPGAILGPGEIGLLASQGHAALSVYRRPRVAILSTGDELRDISDPPRPGSIVNSNAYALAAQVEEAGGEPWILPIVPDILEEVIEQVRTGLSADVLITIGGVSVGDYDLVRKAFDAVGVEPQFWKVAMKPGKPLSFGVFGERLVVGLPGNPVSAMVTFEVFVRPGLRRMLGDPAPYRASAEVRLAAAHKHKTGRTELARARLERDEQGQLVAHLHPRQGSGNLTSVSGANALVILPPDQASFAEGETLRALLLGDPRGSTRSPF